MPDLESAGCFLFWGYNPSVARLDHATRTVAAVGRGARAWPARLIIGCGYVPEPTPRWPSR
jgi:hypothetical protein